MEAFPQSFYCVLTGELMREPVSDPDGNSYERSAIEHWLSTNPVSPVTRRPLRPHELRENRALRQAIDDALEQRRRIGGEIPLRQPQVSAPAPALPAMTGFAVSDSGEIDFYISGCSINGSATDFEIQLSAVPPEGRARTPSDICCVVDISGSMGGEATLATATGAKESHGLSLLDIVKHAVRTVVHSLDQHDRLSVVAYSTAARVLFPLTHMNEAGKQEAERKLATLNPEDTTNIWDGLQFGIDQVKSSGRMSAVLLLTDGLPNVEPPRGTLPMLKRFKESCDGKVLPCAAISTFGFGYSLDSALLEGIAKEGNGMYAFIPDASFVGTAFVNAVSNLLTTVAKNACIILEPVMREVQIDVSEVGFPCTTTDSGAVEISVGTIHYGQRKSSVVRIKAPPGLGSPAQLVRASLRFETANGIRTVSASEAMRNDVQAIQMDGFRQKFVQTVSQSILQMKGADLDGAQGNVKNLIQAIRNNGPLLAQEWTQGLLQDLEGQVSAAFSRKDWFQKWGVHYLPSLARAHLLQECNNFKDPGVQLYGGKLFRELRDQADDIFCRLPPPTPSIVPRSSSISSAPAPRPIQSMAVYNNADNPCFAASSAVAMADGTSKAVADLVKGDLVCTGRPADRGGVAKIACIVQTACADGRAKLVRLGSGLLEATPWHPVQAEDGVWRFPCELGAIEDLPCDAVYSIVLESDAAAALSGADAVDNGGVLIGGVACATLGHGMRDESRLVEAAGWAGHTTVLAHDYFGTAAVIRDLASLTGWSQGRIQFLPGCMERDVETGLLSSFRAETAITAL